jgi:hypothetical protein
MKTDFAEVQAAKMRLLEQSIQLDVERIKFLQDVYSKTEGEPAIIRRAKVFEKTCNEKTLSLDENPFVGTVARKAAAVYPLPEFSCTWIRSQLTGNNFNTGLGAITAEALTPEELSLLHSSVDYWEDKCVFERARKAYEEIYQGEAPVLYQLFSGLVFEQVISFPMGFAILDYEKVLRLGLNGIISEIEIQLAYAIRFLQTRPGTSARRVKVTGSHYWAL